MFHGEKQKVSHWKTKGFTVRNKRFHTGKQAALQCENHAARFAVGCWLEATWCCGVNAVVCHYKTLVLPVQMMYYFTSYWFLGDAMATFQLRLDETLKQKADALFSSLGLDTSTAIRIFLSAAVENNGIPFPVRHTEDFSLQRALLDSRNRVNLHGPYDTALEAVNSMLED